MRAFQFAALLFFLLSEVARAGSCAGDNCLNAMNNHPLSASAFCVPYLGTTQTVTSGIPSFLSNCKASTLRLSSACSCILTSTANTATSNPQASCTATTTITALASTVTSTVTSGPTCPSTATASTITSISISTTVVSGSTCPSVGSPNTITSVSVSTTTITVTAAITPTCTPQITEGDFTSQGGTLNAFTVTEDPVESIFYEILAAGAQSVLPVTDGTLQFLFFFFVNVVPSQYTLSQDIGTLCAPYTAIKLSATIDAAYPGGTVAFCINPTTCSSSQNILPSNGIFVEYTATLFVPPDADVTASVNIATDGSIPNYTFGIGVFQASPS